MADIIQFIPRPNPNRDQRTLEQQAIEIMNVAIIPHDSAIAAHKSENVTVRILDEMFGYVAPETDPA